MKRLLLHACCAPCACAVLERLTLDYDVTVLFFNPNIVPREEYDKRLLELQRFVGDAHRGVPIISTKYVQYTPESCEDCFTLRLEETAKFAVANGFDCFTTTLTLSSKKDAELINEISADLAKKYSVERLWADFKKADGYNRSIALCNEYGIYRQNYCGCNPKRGEEP